MTKLKDNVIHEYHLNRHQPDKPQLAILDLDHHIKTNASRIIKPHIHSFYQIIWFKKGRGTHFVDFKPCEVVDNTIFLVAQNQVHYFDGNTAYEGVLIHFNEAFLLKNESEMEFFLKYNLFNNPYQYPFCRVDRETESVLDEYLALMRREFEDAEQFGKEQILRNCLKSFLIQIQRKKNQSENLSDGPAGLMGEKRLQLVRFINFISENYHKGLTVSEYARLLHMSSRSLSEMTHQLLNKTPSQMIQERIILEAERMLLYSDLNINQIGYRLGFDDPSYFVKYFRKHTHTAPSEFRKSFS